MKRIKEICMDVFIEIVTGLATGIWQTPECFEKPKTEEIPLFI